MIQIPYFFDNNNNITAINRAMNYTTSMINHQTPTISNNMLYQPNPGSLIGSQFNVQMNQQNQQNNVGPNNNHSQTYNMIEQAITHDVSQNNLQPPNEDYESSYHRQLAQNQAMALAQLCAKESSIPQNQLQMSYEDLANNIDYAIEQNFVSTDLHQQSQNVSPSSTRSSVTNLVNQKPPVYTKWTEQEDELLRAAVRMYGPHKWSLIATHVPNRTPMQCSARWVGALNPSILKGRWTSQEDNALKEAVSHYINSVDSQGNPQPIPWNKVSKRIPQRTGAQCQARWTEALDPRIRKGKWSPSEDEILKEGVRMFGRCWIRIAEMIDGRTQRQCRTRWLQIKNKQSRIKNDDSVVTGITAVGAATNSNGDNNSGMHILTPPNTTPSTPAQRIKNVSSNSPDIISQRVILRSSPQIINTNSTAYGTLTSPVSNGSGQSPTISDSETPISSPEFTSEYISTVDDTNSFNIFYNGTYSQIHGTPYIEPINQIDAYIF